MARGLTCRAEGCHVQAKQKCHVCTTDCCALHGHWVKAATIGALRGLTPANASLWLCVGCRTRLGIVMPFADARRSRPVPQLPAGQEH